MRTVLAVAAVVTAYVVGRVFGNELLGGSEPGRTDDVRLPSAGTPRGAQAA